MKQETKTPPAMTPSEETAFSIWLARSLKVYHEGAVHEPIPTQLLALLPPTGNDR